MAHAEAPTVTTTSATAYNVAGGQPPLILMHRDGQERNLGPATPSPGPGQVILPVWYVQARNLRPGDELDLSVPAPVELDVNTGR